MNLSKDLKTFDNYRALWTDNKRDEGVTILVRDEFNVEKISKFSIS